MGNNGAIWPHWKVNLSSLINVCSLNNLQVIAIVMDNASNNTLMSSLKWQCEEQGVPFSAQDAYMCCMPHTVHLAAIKVSNVCSVI